MTEPLDLPPQSILLFTSRRSYAPSSHLPSMTCEAVTGTPTAGEASFQSQSSREGATVSHLYR